MRFTVNAILNLENTVTGQPEVSNRILPPPIETNDLTPAPPNTIIFVKQYVSFTIIVGKLCVPHFI